MGKEYLCRENKKSMPKIFEYFGFIFYFYSNEHEPIHVHVMHGAKESIFDLNHDGRRAFRIVYS